MTGILLLSGMILLLVLALEPAERRLRTWAPRNRDTSFDDRDWQRVQSELQGRVSTSLDLKPRLTGSPSRRHRAA